MAAADLTVRIFFNCMSFLQPLVISVLCSSGRVKLVLWTDWEWMSEWTNESMKFDDSSSKGALSETLSFLRILCETKLSLQFRAHFADRIFQKCSETASFFKTFFMSSLKSRTHFADLIFQKCSEPSNFFNMFKCKASSRYSPGHFSSATFADRGPQPQKQRPYFGDHGSHFTRKNTGFRARECFQAWIYAFQTCYTTWWWCVWHDDLVDMMVRMLPMTRKFSN